MSAVSVNSENIFVSKSLEFDDSDSFCESLRAWNLEFLQLDSGRLRATVEHIGVADLVLQYVRLDRRFHQTGSSPRGTISVGIPDDTGRLEWAGAEAKPHSVQNFNRGSGFDCISEPGFAAHTISLPTTVLGKQCHSLGYDFSEEDVCQSSAQIDCAPGEHKQLRQLIAGLKTVLQKPEPAMTAAVELVSDIQFLLALNISSGSQSGGGDCKATRQQAVTRAIDYIYASGGMAAHSTVCRHAALSARSLSRGFRERFGLTTKQYMIAIRLREVKRKLQSGSMNVTDAASEYGFWHLGRLSSDYRNMFGEYPSETMRRAHQ